MARMYRSILIIMISLLCAAGLASFFDISIGKVDMSELAIKLYLLVIPAMLIAFTITMLFRRATELAISGLILSLLWVVFKWMG